MQYCGYTVSLKKSAMIPSDRALATSCRLSVVTASFCGGLSAIFNEMVQAISGRISETVRDRVKITFNH